LHRHVDVYLDESGDLGFSLGSSKHFIVVALVTQETSRLARIVRRCHRKFGSSCKGNPELKFNRSSEPLRRFFLEGISKTDSWIIWNGIRKSQVDASMRSDKDAIWRHVASRTVSEVSKRIHASSMRIIIDRRSIRKVARKALDDLLLEEVMSHHAGFFPPVVWLSHVDSTASEGLQVADHVAGAVFQSVERDNHAYLKMIEEKIAHGEVQHP
jgi:hypothetical protein